MRFVMDQKSSSIENKQSIGVLGYETTFILEYKFIADIQKIATKHASFFLNGEGLKRVLLFTINLKITRHLFL